MYSVWLIDQDFVDQGILDGIQKNVEQEAIDAVNYALDAAYPSVSEVDLHVFAE